MNLYLRDVVKWLLQERNLNQLELVSRLQGKVTQGNLSAVLSGKRQFTLSMLDHITQALDLEKGSLYLYFEQECYDKRGNLRSQKVHNFILRSYELGLGHVTVKLVNSLIEYGSENRYLLFSIAEKMHESENVKESLSFYDVVIDMEKSTNVESELLDLCYYRRFQILSAAEDESAHDAFVLLVDSLKNLPRRSERNPAGDSDQLTFDAYSQAISYCMERERWSQVMALGEQMGHLAVTWKHSPMLGVSLLYRAEAACVLNKLVVAEEMLNHCDVLAVSSLGTRLESYRFRLSLERGDLSQLDMCMKWLSANPAWLSHLYLIVLKACLTYGTLEDFEQVLEQVGDEFPSFQKEVTRFGRRKWHMNRNRLLAEYQMRKGDPAKGMEHIYLVAQEAIRLSLIEELTGSLQLYRQYRHVVSPEMQYRFVEILCDAK